MANSKSPSPQIILLLGPKGSGKTYIGRLLDRDFDIPFVEVEAMAMKVWESYQNSLGNSASIGDAEYHRLVFIAIEKLLREALSKNEIISFESTGTSSYFLTMQKSLKKDYNLLTLAIKAPPEVCLQRCIERYQRGQIDVSANEIIQINKTAARLLSRADEQVINASEKEGDIKQRLKRILTKHGLN